MSAARVDPPLTGAVPVAAWPVVDRTVGRVMVALAAAWAVLVVAALAFGAGWAVLAEAGPLVPMVLYFPVVVLVRWHRSRDRLRAAR